MIVTRKEKQELMIMSSANLIVSSTNLMVTSAYVTGDLIGGAINEAFKGSKCVGEKLAERFIKKHKINSDWD